MEIPVLWFIMNIEKSTYFHLGLQISKKEWIRYNITELLYQAELYKYKSDVYTFRMLSDRINEIKRIEESAGEPIYTGQLMVVGLINDIFRYIIELHCIEDNPGSMDKGVDSIRQNAGTIAVDKPFNGFVKYYPPLGIELEKFSENDFLKKTSTNVEKRIQVLSEMIVLFLGMGNPAFKPFHILFDDSEYQQQTKYLYLVTNLEYFYNTQPHFRKLNIPLFKVLRAPILANPYSLDGQLEYMLENWAEFLPEYLLKRVKLVRDIYKEETVRRGFGAGPSRVMEFGIHADVDINDYLEPERFSPDADWMSNVVLIAKSVYVWLDQLSRKYKRSITKLDEIPDEELNSLANWGFTGLWLIGVWERSPASQKIKQIMGNPEAAPSAYSLYDYTISNALGGEDAYLNLKNRAMERGIRLASDMVPNHMGIYSKWVIEHPDWFMSQDFPPFPNYKFTGNNLSWDNRVGIHIEDGYWNHSDAAVVFRRTDNWTGTIKYIYHGNDGTHMPWNDTAQLDYLNPEVREAVIQMILHVARKFSIIRFDAAMTLAKKHYQRLWFPKPGEGGAIPSRTECSMTREEFDKHIPEEFWREVVDRVAQEVPDTLLLAEAFWLMEGYFVRTLGMHRVYNSAFMNMLKMEENANYRTTIKNVLEFSPEVLKRFVNFMNNPDEKTAVEQFGKSDKYFGVAVMMATMPGLPMFGHGQIEGFTEKYGMEYQRAYWDEPVDEELVKRHEREIFPLLKIRYLFSGVENFTLFDFYTPEGFVDENVFAYSNMASGKRSIVIYNNAYRTTKGWVKTSTQINIGKSDEPNFIRRTVSDALSINSNDICFYKFRDHRSNLEYLRSGKQIEEDGFYAELYGYQYNLFLDFREIFDPDGSWAEFSHILNGTGVPNIELAYKELQLKNVTEPFNNLIRISKNLTDEEVKEIELEKYWKEFKINSENLLSELEKREIQITDKEKIYENIKFDIDKINDIKELNFQAPCEEITHQYILSIGIILKHFKKLFKDSNWLDEWLFSNSIENILKEFGIDEWHSKHYINLLKILLKYKNVFNSVDEPEKENQLLLNMFNDETVKNYILVNYHNDIRWMNKEQLEILLHYLFIFSLICNDDDRDTKQLTEILSLAEKSGYQMDEFIRMICA